MQTLFDKPNGIQYGNIKVHNHTMRDIEVLNNAGIKWTYIDYEKLNKKIK